MFRFNLQDQEGNTTGQSIRPLPRQYLATIPPLPVHRRYTLARTPRTTNRITEALINPSLYIGQSRPGIDQTEGDRGGDM